MKVHLLNEAGYDEALLGLSLSFYDHAEPLSTWWNAEKKLKAAKRLKALAFKGGGHSKALASIYVWLFIQAPRCFWSEYDTYKVATTANSSSTMHTLSKREVTIDDFERGTILEAVYNLNDCIRSYNNPDSYWYHDVTRLKMNLPEGYLQERQVCVNYMTLQNIIKQRQGHRLKLWDKFIHEVLDQVKHPYLLKEIS